MKRSFSLSLVIALTCVSMSVACSGGASTETPAAPEGTAPAVPATPAEVPTTPTTAPTGSSVVSRAPTPATGCPATDPNALAQPGTMHASEVAANETLDAAGSPHRFPEGVSINAATLAIEPCALVLVQSGAIWVNAQSTLLAPGTSDRPITIRSADPVAARGAWGGVYFGNEATSRSQLSYVTIANAGGDAGYAERGAIWVDGATTVALNDVTISQSGGHGISFRSTARFAPSSASLHFVNGGAADMGAALVAFASADSVGSLPEVTQEANDNPEILVVGDESTRVLTTQTWRNPGVRYHARQDLEVRGPSGPVLTIAPGTTLAFDGERSFYVGWDEDGGLVADGGADETRITFTSARREVSPGDWVAIVFGDHTLRQSTRLSFANVVAAGGAPAWNAQNDCGQGNGATYAIQIRDRDLPAISHVRFSQLPEACVAIQRAFVSDAPTDFTAAALGNDFAQMGARCPQSFVEPTTGCPETVPGC